MLHYNLAHWSTFLTMAFVLNLAPGPDIAFILGHTARGGKRHGAAAMLGVWTGVLGHITLAVVGLSAIIAASAEAFAVVKWVGVAYLFWLGVQALRSQGDFLTARRAETSGDLMRIFGQGILVNLLNPKVAIFFLAFLPQFVVTGAGPIWLQLFVHGVLIIAVAATIEPLLIFFGDRITAHLRANPRSGLWLDRALGGMLIGLGVKLAIAQR
ncbi:MAG TPA: LysE family translocator [Rhizomicrobium sp.]|jgi:threonine/homoserine/homoserine lactone efflux protein